MRITFSQDAWSDFALLQADRHLVKRLNQLLADISRDAYTGIGRPEQLRGDLAGFWSRRLDDRHRLVYRVTADTIEIIQCQGHYGDH
ncbi:MAG: Txe/YoeB family addiction module toxin [Propionibacteriaceae bacterium]|nr:Txe/YoeB family addiction module toxin [Propionibacteriaceae bacterium]